MKVKAMTALAAAVAAAFAVLLAACQSLEIEYTAPPEAGKVAEIDAQAGKGYQFFVLPKMVILVAPVDDIRGGPEGTDRVSSATKPEASAGQTGGQSLRIGSAAARAASAPPAAPAMLAATGPRAAAADVTGADSNRLANATIDGKTWAAVPVPVADPANGFVVRGVAGVWQKTTLSISYYKNTDIPSSVSSNAENLFPKRVEQLTGIVATLLGGLSAVDSGSARSPLEPFKLEVPAESMKEPAELQVGWTYQFEYAPSTKPSGTIDLAQFRELVKGRKVGYWPVPACRSATLTLARGRQKYAFYLTVSSTDSLRLQPMPVAGKADLGTICNASISGQANGDHFADALSNLEALQKAEKKLSGIGAAASTPAR